MRKRKVAFDDEKVMGRRGKMRRVSFDTVAKTHDGLQKETRLFDHLMEKLYLKRDIDGTQSDLLKYSKEEAKVVMSMSTELLERLDQSVAPDENVSPNVSVPVILRGGGKCRFKLNQSHIQALRWVEMVADIRIKH